ncbi:LysR family transcriptional regulator [Nocardia sp. NPDC003979]
MDVTVGQLEALLSVDEHRSFTRAADALNLTQSAVSRAIATLEKQLGRQLVHRSPRGATLTRAGREVADHGASIIARLSMIEALADSSEPPQLRVGAVGSAMARLVPQTLERLRRDHPGLRVLTVEGDDDELSAWLDAGTIDMSISTIDHIGTNPTTTLEDQFVAAVPHDHRLTRDDRIDLADLSAAGIVDPGGTCGPLLAHQFEDHGALWRPDHTVRGTSTALAMVAHGITAAIVPAMAVPDPLPEGVALRGLRPPLHRRLYVRHEPHNKYATELARLLDTANSVLAERFL